MGEGRKNRPHNAEAAPAEGGEAPAGGLHPNPMIARAMMSRWVQRRADQQAGDDGKDGEVGHEAVERAEGASGGTALPEKLQRKFGASLGSDVSGVRVHTGGESAAAAKA